ncbi:hypothetical protein DSM3645_10922 [Blastopirellula marina DSM 3645]|uniref:Uncharacterized protein n=1 Tax=Blastopirellula marina DSM 3645 TaxID=314230 RepID=A3ZSS8_9BACT|nr:hypothetical protein DSM3645_10922 [Blastopirellula marina DSM 3645]
MFDFAGEVLIFVWMPAEFRCLRYGLVSMFFLLSPNSARECAGFARDFAKVVGQVQFLGEPLFLTSSLMVSRLPAKQLACGFDPRRRFFDASNGRRDTPAALRSLQQIDS